MKKTIEFLCLAALSSMPMQVTGQAMPTVAIIGTGDMGNSLGPKIARLGYPVVYGSREPSRETVRELVEQTGANASAASQRDAAARAQIVILAVQWEHMESVAQNLGDLNGKIVVDFSSPVRPGADGYMEQGVQTSAAEVIQNWKPGAKVVKVGIPSSYIVDDPMTLGTTPTVPIATNDREAKETVANLIAGIGLDPWDAGPLRFSRSIESYLLLFWVPLQQGRKEGIEFKLLRSSYWPCVWDVVKEFGPTADAANLARFPQQEAPRPCDSYRSR